MVLMSSGGRVKFLLTLTTSTVLPIRILSRIHLKYIGSRIFHVKAQVAIQFGMMECSPTVDAEICVFDPQSPNNPSGFRSCGSNAKRLAFIANAEKLNC